MSAHARIVGLDIARSLAIIGMIVLHMANLVWSTKVVLSGLPAAGFVIIAGTTMMILARDYSLRVFMKLVARGCLIMLIGVALLPVGGEIQVVLVVMGAAMALTAWVPPSRRATPSWRSWRTWWRACCFTTSTSPAPPAPTPLRPRWLPLSPASACGSASTRISPAGCALRGIRVCSVKSFFPWLLLRWCYTCA